MPPRSEASVCVVEAYLSSTSGEKCCPSSASRYGVQTFGSAAAAAVPQRSSGLQAFPFEDAGTAANRGYWPPVPTPRRGPSSNASAASSANCRRGNSLASNASAFASTVATLQGAHNQKELVLAAKASFDGSALTHPNSARQMRAHHASYAGGGGSSSSSSPAGTGATNSVVTTSSGATTLLIRDAAMSLQTMFPTGISQSSGDAKQLASDCNASSRILAPAPTSSAFPSLLRGGGKLGEDCASVAESDGTGVVSHATTPSWRSRSFTPSQLEATPRLRCIPGNSATRGGRPARGHMPLPAEARWALLHGAQAASSSSEVRRLEDADSAVNEANAALVDAFLNVKRTPPSTVGSIAMSGLTAPQQRKGA